MTTFYVATLSQYVLVEAKDETAARAAAVPGLTARYAGFGLSPDDIATRIRTVRPATADEIEFWQAHQTAVAQEQAVYLEARTGHGMHRTARGRLLATSLATRALRATTGNPGA